MTSVFPFASPEPLLEPAKRLLIVNHEPLELKILQNLIRVSDLASDGVCGGLEAIDRLKVGSYDAVLLDMKLRDVNGALLLKFVRQNHDVPIVVISDFASDQEKIDVWDAGADDVIVKPYNPGELLARVRAALRRRSHGTASGS